MAGGTGFGYGIDLSGLDSAIDSADKKLKKLAVTGENATRAISDAFIAATQSVKDFGLALQSNGLGAIKKGSKDAINAINQMSQALAKMNNDASASGRSQTLSVFGNALDNLMNKINRLKNEIDLFREWEGGQLLNNSDYVNIGKVTDEINRLMSAYVALDNAQKSISQSQPFNQHIDKLSRQDLDSQRYKDSMKAMREFYAEQDKEGKRAVKEAEKNAKQEQKVYEKSYKERAKLYQQENQKRNQTFEGSLAFSKTAQTANRSIVAIKNLEAARNSLSRTDADYANKVKRLNDEIRRHQTEIDKTKVKSDKLRKSHSNLMDISGQLARKLALVFSVSQVAGYMRKLVEVRGEFELQQKALQAIVQNVDEANKLWEKTVALAVKSPFRVKELVTYTKQLAAYRVETDKLYDTTKMLADVSAGLGVDMQRLILAFGQVKAANYLRGTELRQFSEAGINILGELATYFTELEGRAVSVGDVFERVSRRMVAFADVEEIFRRITSEGGTFYNMQAIQAETLKGQMSNLRDSIDIMLNDIGKENEDMMKGMIQGVRRIVENWEYLAIVVKDVASVLIISSLGSFIKGLTLTDNALKKALKSGRGLVAMGAKLKTSFNSLWASITTHPWLALGAAILSVVTVIGQMIRASNKLKRELSDLSMQGAFDASHSVAEYKRLASVVTDVTATYDEQKEALSVLQRKYADILPDHLLQADTIRDLQGNYEEATNAIYEYIAAKTKEKQIETISSELGSKVEERAVDLADDIKKALSKVAPNITKADVLPIVNKLRELIQVGDVSVLNVDETIKSLVKEFTGLEISADAWKYTFSAANGEMVTLDDNAESLVRSISRMNSAMRDVTSSSLEWHDAFIYNDFNEIRDVAEETRKSLSSLFAIIRDYGKKDKAGNALVSDETYNNTIAKLDKLFAEVGIKGVEWSSIINDPFKLQKTTTDYNVARWGKMIEEIKEMPILPSQSGAKSNFLEMLMGEQDAFKGTKFQQEVSRILLDLSDEMEVSLEGLNSLFAASDQSVADYAKTVQSTLETLKTNVAEYDNDIAKGVNFSPLDPAKIDLMREQIPMVEDFLELFNIYLDKSKQSAQEDTFSPKLRVIREIYDEYKKLDDLFDDIQAKEGAMAKFGDAFKEAFGKTPEELGFDLFSQDGIERAYDYLISQAPDAKKKIQAELAKGEVVWDLKIQRKEEEDKKLFKEIDNMFDNYELVLELKKLHIPSNLWGVSDINLSQIRKKVESELFKAESTGGQKERVNNLKETLAKIDDMERKAAEERMKTYAKYLTEGMNERVRLKVEELRKLKELEESKEFNPDQKQQIRQQIKADSSKQLDKLAWEEFKGTEWYTMMFTDLEVLGTQAIKNLHGELSSLKNSLSNLDPSEVKEIVSQMEKLQEQLIERNPFKAFAEARKSIKALGQTEEDIIGQLQAHENAEAYAQKMLDMLAEIEVARSERNLGQLEGETLAMFQNLRSQVLSGNTQAFKEAKAEYEEMLQSAKEGKKLTAEQVKMFSDYRKSLQGIADYWGALDGQIKNITDSAKGVMEAFGADEISLALADGISNMSTLITQAVQFGIQMQVAGYAANMALGVIGWIAMAIQAVATVISAIANVKNARIDAQLEHQAELIEKQRDLFEQIEEKVEKAYSVDQLRQYNKELERSVELEIQALEASIALEKSRKKADFEQIGDWEKEIQEAKERLADAREEMAEEVGGIFDLTDFTSGFIDAWWDAMDEGMSGLDALNEHFDDTMKDMVKKQALYRGAKKIMEQVMDAVNTSLDDDYFISEEEWASIQDAAKKANINLDAYLKGWKDLFGSFSNESGESLSALQKGIQGITEDTGQIIESYLNSVRFFVESISRDTASQLTEVKAMHKLLDSVVLAGHPKGRSGIKVFMD